VCIALHVFHQLVAVAALPVGAVVHMTRAGLRSRLRAEAAGSAPKAQVD
jgi:hypothetical protein